MKPVSAFVISIALAASGCALSPTSEQAAAFGRASELGLAAFENAAETGNTMRRSIAIDRAFCDFMKGAPARLAAASALQTRVSLEKRIELLRSMRLYASRLVAATDPKLMADLDEAAGDFTSSVTNLAGKVVALQGPGITASPVVAPLAKLVSGLLVDLYEYEHRARLRAIVIQMHPDLASARNHIVSPTTQSGRSIAGDIRHLRDVERQYRSARACVLHHMRAGGSPVTELHREFVEIDAEARANAARVALFGNLPHLTELLDNIVETHFALQDSSIDFVETLHKLRRHLDAITEVLEVID